MGIANPKLLGGLGTVRAVATEHMSVTNEDDVAMHDIKQAADGLESLLSDCNARIAALAIAAAVLNTTIVRCGYMVTVSPTGMVSCQYLSNQAVREAVAVMELDSRQAIC